MDANTAHYLCAGNNVKTQTWELIIFYLPYFIQLLDTCDHEKAIKNQ